MKTDLSNEKILFLDIETAPIVYQYKDLSNEEKKLWDKKWQYNEEIDAKERYSKAGIYAEFAKVVCISFANFHNGKLYVKAFSGHDERYILEQFAEHLDTFYNSDSHNLCAHNGKEFDFPFLCRRMIINNIRLPKILSIGGKKPWDVKFIDTMEMWKFGDHKNYTSLELLAHVLNLPSPKGEIDGSDVAKTYWEKNDLETIKTYCMKDVITLASVYCRLSSLPAVSEEDLIFVTI